MSTRESKLRFIGDKYALARAVDDMLSRRGTDWLTDEQVDDLVSREITEWRFDRKLRRQNRAIRAERQRKEKAA